jgi:type II secretory pathway pseudopilin PulG
VVFGLKQHYRGITLIEILFVLSILSFALVFLIPHQLQKTHQTSVDKIVSEMDQIVLAARNYYQDKQEDANGSASNASYWPQTLQALVDERYIAPGLLCSAIPTSTITKTCGGYQGYAVFPANTQGQYDTTVPGVAPYNSNSGGSFWGVSLTLPNAKMAEEVRQKLPFATRCSTADLIAALKNATTNLSCKVDDSNTTVTAIVPRPAVFSKPLYAKDGLIQSMGSIKVCDTQDNCNSHTASGKGKDTTIKVPIAMPITCDEGLTPVLFVYPFDFGWNLITTKSDVDYPGITVQTTRDDSTHQWTVMVAESGDSINTNGTANFSSIYLAYFTVCAPNKSDDNKWDPSSFIGAGLLAHTDDTK